MNTRTIVLLVWAFGIASCASEVPRGNGNLARNDVPALAGASSVDRTPVDRSPAELVDEAMRAGPSQVVSLLLQWDTAGVRFTVDHAAALKRVNCYNPPGECFNEEPGWDIAAAVSGYAVERLYEGRDSAAFAITFDQIGVLSHDLMERDRSSVSNVIRLKQSDGQWKIVGVESPMMPHLSRRVALERYAGRAADSAALAEWLFDPE